MKCNKCDNETYIDHVAIEEGKETFVYVCVNPNCESYKQAFTLLGGETNTEIT